MKELQVGLDALTRESCDNSIRQHSILIYIPNPGISILIGIAHFLQTKLIFIHIWELSWNQTMKLRVTLKNWKLQLNIGAEDSV